MEADDEMAEAFGVAGSHIGRTARVCGPQRE